MARALGSYEGSLREAIHRWKYQGKTYLTPFLGEWMEEGLRRYWDPEALDLLIPVPLHIERLRDRGFNQALLLVKELSRRTGIPYPLKVLQHDDLLEYGLFDAPLIFHDLFSCPLRGKYL